MFWKQFPTQAAARNAIRDIVDSKEHAVPFESDLISDLIAERHYFCSARGLRPVRFRKINKGKGYTFEGDFSSCEIEPPLTWHAVSWSKCLKGAPPTPWEHIESAMRKHCMPAKTAYRNAHPQCEQCGATETLEVHHSEPTFQDIVQCIRTQIDDADIQRCLANWNWFEKGDFKLPGGDKITQLFEVIHQTAILQVLCQPCHHASHRAS